MKLKKSLGQHFLHSTKIISDIVEAGDIHHDDTALEIGPGQGILTRGLLLTGAKVVTVEKDDRLIPILQKKFAIEIASKQLILVHGDILNMDMSKATFDIKKYKIVANIPYYVTGQIIRMFLENEHQPESMTLLVQKEVAERIVARDKKESLLSLSVKAFGAPKLIRTVGKGAFSPQPNVDSAVLLISDISKKRLEGLPEKLFFELLHAGFAHKRKQLLSNLQNMAIPKGLLTPSVSWFGKDTVVKGLQECGIDQKARAEDIPLETWIKLCKKLTNT